MNISLNILPDKFLSTGFIFWDDIGDVAPPPLIIELVLKTEGGYTAP